MSSDLYAVLRALLRAEAVRSTPKPEETKAAEPPRPRPQEQKRG
ncbi:hypothetical protein [Streptomyces shenzhenensis]|nr:hypothetical protein [Streptomyces shenzhenensis]